MWALITAISGKWWLGFIVFALVVLLGCVDYYDQRQAQQQVELTRQQWILARAYAERFNAAASAGGAASSKEQANLLWEHPELFWTPRAIPPGRGVFQSTTGKAIRADGG
jgi:hypothetical protein